MSVKGALQMLAVAAFLFSGCSREEPVDLNRPIKIENFAMGTALGPTGGIAYGADHKMFETGTIINVAMALKHAPVGTPVRVVWKGPGGDVIGQETKTVRRGQRFMNFAADSNVIPVMRNYQVDVFVHGTLLTNLRFDVILAT